jgi:glycosyltransferase involved in cell wall biosynthesis
VKRIVVDLTPLLPGAENGGAKLLAMELVRLLSRLKESWEFFLLTNNLSQDELATLDSPNVRRVCVRQVPPPGSSPSSPLRAAQMRAWMKGWLKRSLPPYIFSKGKAIYGSMRARRRASPGVLGELKADLLFCPFTLPIFYDSTVPVVSIIYDLQYRYYPQFFDLEDHNDRERNFRETCRLADRLVCISHFVKETVLQNTNLKPDQVIAIPIRLSGRLKRPSPETISSTLKKYRLGLNDFLFYPANFWPHKNHRMLFTAFGMFCHRHPESTLSLVCTGAPDGRMITLQEAVRRMGLEKRIVFPGHLPAEYFSALFSSCRALIFPSLYEGFGMPVLEAMSMGKPVLCSDAASLPEVGGEAALYFNPQKPDDIFRAIETILDNRELAERLVERGRRWTIPFQNNLLMAEKYLAVFQEVWR